LAGNNFFCGLKRDDEGYDDDNERGLLNLIGFGFEFGFQKISKLKNFAPKKKQN